MHLGVSGGSCKLEDEEEGEEDAWGKVVGRATSPLDKKVGERAFPRVRAGELDDFVMGLRSAGESGYGAARRATDGGLVRAGILLVGQLLHQNGVPPLVNFRECVLLDSPRAGCATRSRGLGLSLGWRERRGFGGHGETELDAERGERGWSHL